MKWLLLCFLIVTQVSMAQDSKFGEKSFYNKTIFNFTAPNFAGPTSLDQVPRPLGADREVWDQTNTAPTPIPEDTSLIFRPSNNTFRQAQEENPLNSNTLRNDTEIIPGDIKKGDRGGQKGDMKYYP